MRARASASRLGLESLGGAFLIERLSIAASRVD